MDVTCRKKSVEAVEILGLGKFVPITLLGLAMLILASQRLDMAQSRVATMTSSVVFAIDLD